MKPLVLIVINLLLSNITLAQTNKLNHFGKIDSVKVVSTVEVNHREQMLEERLQQASDTIENLNIVISAFGIIFGLVVGLLSLGGYFYIIKPYNDLKKVINKGVSKYLKDERKNRIDQAIEELRNRNIVIQDKGLSTLILSQPLELSNEQVAQIIMLYESDMHIDQKSTVASLLIYQESKQVERFYRQMMIDETDSSILSSAITYIMKLPSNFKILETIFKKSNERKRLYKEVLSRLSFSREAALEFLNNQSISELLLETIKSPGYFQSYNIELKDTIINLRGISKISQDDYRTTFIFHQLKQGAQREGLEIK